MSIETTTIPEVQPYSTTFEVTQPLDYVSTKVDFRSGEAKRVLDIYLNDLSLYGQGSTESVLTQLRTGFGGKAKDILGKIPQVFKSKYTSIIRVASETIGKVTDSVTDSQLKSLEKQGKQDTLQYKVLDAVKSLGYNPQDELRSLTGEIFSDSEQFSTPKKIEDSLIRNIFKTLRPVLSREGVLKGAVTDSKSARLLMTLASLTPSGDTGNILNDVQAFSNNSEIIPERLQAVLQVISTQILKAREVAYLIQSQEETTAAQTAKKMLTAQEQVSGRTHGQQRNVTSKAADFVTAFGVAPLSMITGSLKAGLENLNANGQFDAIYKDVYSSLVGLKEINVSILSEPEKIALSLQAKKKSLEIFLQINEKQTKFTVNEAKAQTKQNISGILTRSAARVGGVRDMKMITNGNIAAGVDEMDILTLITTQTRAIEQMEQSIKQAGVESLMSDLEDSTDNIYTSGKVGHLEKQINNLIRTVTPKSAWLILKSTARNALNVTSSLVAYRPYVALGGAVGASVGASVGLNTGFAGQTGLSNGQSGFDNVDVTAAFQAAMGLDSKSSHSTGDMLAKIPTTIVSRTFYPVIMATQGLEAGTHAASNLASFAVRMGVIDSIQQIASGNFKQVLERLSGNRVELTGSRENYVTVEVGGKSKSITIESAHTDITGKLLNAGQGTVYNGLYISNLSSDDLSDSSVRTQVLQKVNTSAVSVTLPSNANINIHGASGMVSLSGLEARANDSTSSLNDYIFNVNGNEISASDSGQLFNINGNTYSVAGSSLGVDSEPVLMLVPVEKALNSPNGAIDPSKAQFVQYSSNAAELGAVGGDLIVPTNQVSAATQPVQNHVVVKAKFEPALAPESVQNVAPVTPARVEPVQPRVEPIQSRAAQNRAILVEQRGKYDANPNQAQERADRMRAPIAYDSRITTLPIPNNPARQANTNTFNPNSRFTVANNGLNLGRTSIVDNNSAQPVTYNVTTQASINLNGTSPRPVFNPIGDMSTMSVAPAGVTLPNRPVALVSDPNMFTGIGGPDLLSSLVDNAPIVAPTAEIVKAAPNKIYTDPQGNVFIIGKTLNDKGKSVQTVVQINSPLDLAQQNLHPHQVARINSELNKSLNQKAGAGLTGIGSVVDPRTTATLLTQSGQRYLKQQLVIAINTNNNLTRQSGFFTPQEERLYTSMVKGQPISESQFDKTFLNTRLRTTDGRLVTGKQLIAEVNSKSQIERLALAKTMSEKLGEATTTTFAKAESKLEGGSKFNIVQFILGLATGKSVSLGFDTQTNGSTQITTVSELPDKLNVNIDTPATLTASLNKILADTDAKLADPNISTADRENLVAMRPTLAQKINELQQQPALADTVVKQLQQSWNVKKNSNGGATLEIPLISSLKIVGNGQITLDIADTGKTIIVDAKTKPELYQALIKGNLSPSQQGELINLTETAKNGNEMLNVVNSTSSKFHSYGLDNFKGIAPSIAEYRRFDEFGAPVVRSQVSEAYLSLEIASKYISVGQQDKAAQIINAILYTNGSLRPEVKQEFGSLNISAEVKSRLATGNLTAGDLKAVLSQVRGNHNIALINAFEENIQGMQEKPDIENTRLFNVGTNGSVFSAPVNTNSYDPKAFLDEQLKVSMTPNALAELEAKRNFYKLIGFNTAVLEGKIDTKGKNRNFTEQNNATLASVPATALEAARENMKKNPENTILATNSLGIFGITILNRESRDGGSTGLNSHLIKTVVDTVANVLGIPMFTQAHTSKVIDQGIGQANYNPDTLQLNSDAVLQATALGTVNQILASNPDIQKEVYRLTQGTGNNGESLVNALSKAIDQKARGSQGILIVNGEQVRIDSAKLPELIKSYMEARNKISYGKNLGATTGVPGANLLSDPFAVVKMADGQITSLPTDLVKEMKIKAENYLKADLNSVRAETKYDSRTDISTSSLEKIFGRLGVSFENNDTIVKYQTVNGTVSYATLPENTLAKFSPAQVQEVAQSGNGRVFFELVFCNNAGYLEVINGKTELVYTRRGGIDVEITPEKQVQVSGTTSTSHDTVQVNIPIPQPRPPEQPPEQKPVEPTPETPAVSKTVKPEVGPPADIPPQGPGAPVTAGQVPPPSTVVGPPAPSQIPPTFNGTPVQAPTPTMVSPLGQPIIGNPAPSVNIATPFTPPTPGAGVFNGAPVLPNTAPLNGTIPTTTIGPINSIPVPAPVNVFTPPSVSIPANIPTVAPTGFTLPPLPTGVPAPTLLPNIPKLGTSSLPTNGNVFAFNPDRPTQTFDPTSRKFDEELLRRQNSQNKVGTSADNVA